MTAQADPLPRAQRAPLALPGLAQVWLLVAAALAGMSLPNLVDPMIRYDDFPALLGHADTFWPKTLHEGRWLNYWWHLRGMTSPAWLNFALYQTLWALFAASAAWLLTAQRNAAALIAVMIVIAPPATLISLWFNTLLPGLALVALYALMATRLAPQALRAWMPVFVVLSFMAYTTYPLLILIICLLRTERYGLRALAEVLALFSVSFLAAVLVVYSLNWQVHGVFGVPLADWRAATPASDLAGLRANLPLVGQSFADLGDKASFGFAPMLWGHLALFAVASAVMLRHRPGPALWLLAGLATGVALVVVQVLKMGALVPPRGFIFVWVIYALIAGGALQAVQGQALRWMRNAVFLVIGSYALQTFLQYQTYRGWQAESRAVAIQVSGSVSGVFSGAVSDRIHVAPDVIGAATARAAFVQDPQALAYRIEQITGVQAQVCAACVPHVRLGAAGNLVVSR